MITVQLPEDLERFLRGEVQSGRFASADEAVSEALRRLRQQREGTEAHAKPLTEDEWQQQLVDSGLLARIPPRGAARPPRPPFQPIPLAGEPLSETILRERR
jgi:putative addiction module CopG family antidote